MRTEGQGVGMRGRGSYRGSESENEEKQQGLCLPLGFC